MGKWLSTKEMFSGQREAFSLEDEEKIIKGSMAFTIFKRGCILPMTVGKIDGFIRIPKS
jgi:hypothetical protein